MSNIVFFETEKWEEGFLKSAFPQDQVMFHPHTISNHPEDDTSIFDAEIISVFIYSQLTKDVLAKFPHLKYIVTRSVGYDHIDLGFCKEKGIVVSNVPTYGPHTVAEHAFALLLAISRKIIPSVERTRKGDFRLEDLMGFELYQKKLGIIGVGNIGKLVAQMALAFGMKVIAFNKHEDDELKAKGVTFMALDELLGQSDVISMHVPLTIETKHLLNTTNLDKCKKGMIVINTARGAIIETQALIDGLERGIFAGAGLDVLEGECDIREERELVSTEFLKSCDLKTQLLNHMLLQRQDVIITPHNAFNSKEALDEILKTTVENIQSFQKATPQNVVTTA